METVRVELGPRSYSVALGAADFGALVRAALPRSTNALVVSDGNARAHADAVRQSLEAAGVACSFALVPAGESTKCLGELATLLDALAAMPADRQTVVVAVGGGVVGDLAGFAAAVYNRGIPLVMVPTTLLAMVDSSVGGKTGINHAAGKNLVGAFHQPALVWAEPRFLDTLPAREYLSGLAEVVKYGVILDPAFFAWLEAHAEALVRRDRTAVLHVVRRSCELKAHVVAQDEREETGLRAVLNYGHTFAHAFETVGGYGAWLHGEAVSAGMCCAWKLAAKLGRVPPDVRQAALLRRFQLPTEPLPAWSAEELLAVMRRDKKAAAGALRFVLPTRLGHAELVAVPEAAVREILRSP